MRNPRHPRWATMISALLFAASGCGYGVGSANGATVSRDLAGAVWLNVTNSSNGPMEIYGAGSGTSYRIGTVYPGFTTQFAVRSGTIVNGPVEFVARAKGRWPLYRSGPLLLAPGNIVDFALEDSPVNSVATVRPVAIRDW